MDALGLPRDVTVINSGMLAYAKVEMFDEVVQVSEVSCHSTVRNGICRPCHACAAPCAQSVRSCRTFNPTQ